MKAFNIRIEFGKQAKKFRLHFGLDQKQLSKLSDMSPSEYSDLEKGFTNYNVQKLQNVSSVYNLYYFQMGNPKCTPPSFSKLPLKTKEAIKNRKEPLKIYKNRLIVEHLTLVLNKINNTTKFLIQEIQEQIIDEFDIRYEKEEISGTIKKRFEKYVNKTTERNLGKEGPGPKPFYYQLKTAIPKEMTEEALHLITNRTHELK